MSKKKETLIHYIERPLKNIRIGLDVDGVLAFDKAIEWVKTKFSDDQEKYYPFLMDILKYDDFEKNFEKHGIKDYMDYWKNPKLYDNDIFSIPSLYIINMLKRRYEPFCDIDWIIISDCFAEHRDSKINFLKREFPESFQFFDRKHKYEIQCDVYVDDKISNLKECRENRDCYTILVDQIYNRLKFSDDDFIPDEVLNTDEIFHAYIRQATKDERIEDE